MRGTGQVSLTRSKIGGLVFRYKNVVAGKSAELVDTRFELSL